MSEVVITMKMDGIEGESKVKGADKEADLLHFAYAAHTAIENRGPGLSGPGSATVTPVSVQKKVCAATPKLENQFFSGKPIANVVLKEYKTDSDNQPVPYMVVTLTNVRLSAYQVQVGGFENFEMHFESVEREFFSQDTATGKLASKGKTKFDLLTKEVS